MQGVHCGRRILDAQNWLHCVSRFFSDQPGCHERLRGRKLEGCGGGVRCHPALGARRPRRHLAGISDSDLVVQAPHLRHAHHCGWHRRTEGYTGVGKLSPIRCSSNPAYSFDLRSFSRRRDCSTAGEQPLIGISLERCSSATPRSPSRKIVSSSSMDQYGHRPA
jgi:hypothetical protein